MRLACAVLVLAVVATTGGERDGTRDQPRRTLHAAESVATGEVLVRMEGVANTTRGAGGGRINQAQESGYSLRIHGLASDRPATPENTPTAGPVAVLTATAEPATPTPEPTRDAPVFGAAIEQWRSLVASIFPAWAVNTALRIMDCESKGDPNAIGAQGELGLFQIMPYWHPDATLDPTGNVLAAYRISNGGRDWSAWSCR